MSPWLHRRLLFATLLITSLLPAAQALAQSSNGTFTLRQETFTAAGGQVGTGNPTQAQTCLGLPAAGRASNGIFTVTGGLVTMGRATKPPITAQLTVTGTVNDPAASVTVNGAPAIMANGAFTASNITLTLGPNVITAAATDPLGNRTVKSATVYLDLPEAKKTPRFAITARGAISDSASTISVNGVAATIASGSFSASVPLVDGMNTLTATARDAAGNTATATRRVFVPLPTQLPARPTVGTVGAPMPSVTTQTSVTIGGTKTAGMSIWINCSQVYAADNGTQWTAAVALIEGDNRLRVVSKDAAGASSAEAIANVILDNLPPVITVSSPIKTNFNPFAFSGSVDDSLTRVQIGGIQATNTGGIFTAQLPLVKGANSFTIAATSPNGFSSSQPLSVTLGTIPTIQTVLPPDRSKLYLGTSITIQITAQDAESDPMKYQVLLDDAPMGAPASASSLAWTPGTGQMGAHTLTARASDDYGGGGTQDVQVLVIRQPVQPPN